MNEDHLFFVGQKAFIQKDKKVLILNHPEKGLDFPGGKITNEDTHFTEALMREVREETGLEISVGEPFHVWNNSNKNIYLVGFSCNYIRGEVSISKEHNNYMWVGREDYKKLDGKNSYFIPLEIYIHKYL